MSIIEDPPLDAEKLEQFVFRAVDEVGATLNAALVVMGDRLGLYRALAGAGALTSGELAARTGTAERYVREWLNAQAAGGYVEYHPAEGRYSLPPEQAVALTDEDSPAYLPGFFQNALGTVLDSPRITDAAHRRRRRLARAQPRCPRGLRALLPARLQRQPRRSWLPALDGVVERSSGRPGRRRGLRPRRLDDPDGRRLPELDVHGLRLPRRVDRDGPPPRREAGVEDRVRFEVRRRRLQRRGLRPRDDVRLPARHGRPRRRGAARARDARARRHVDDRRARRRRSVEDNLNPSAAPTTGSRPCVHTGVAVPGNRPGAGAQAGRARIATSSPRPASATSAAPPRLHSTWSSRCDPDPA